MAHIINSNTCHPSSESVAPVPNAERDHPVAVICRCLAIACVISELLLTICRSTVLIIPLSIPADGIIYSDTLLLSLIGLTSLSAWHRLKKADRSLPAAIVGFAAVVAVAAVVHGAAGSPFDLCRALVVPLTIFSLAYVCPAVLKKSDYRLIFGVVLAVFSLHALLTAWLCFSQTHQLFGLDISCNEGRVPVLFGYAGTLVTGLFCNPNTLAELLLLLPALALTVEHQASSGAAKWLARVALLLVACHLVATLSRAALCTAALSFAIWGGLKGRQAQAIRAACAAAAAAIGLVLLYSIFNASHEPSMLMRFNIWQYCLTKIIQAPLGHGLPPFGMEQMPHNFLIGNALYYGLPGLFLLLCVLFELTWPLANKVKNGLPQSLLWLTCVLAVVLHGSFEYLIGHPCQGANSLFWLALGFLYQSRRQDRAGRVPELSASSYRVT